MKTRGFLVAGLLSLSASAIAHAQVIPSAPTTPLAPTASAASVARKDAARIEADETDIPIRRASIRYLATIDCHKDLEAENALLSGLRGNGSEGVRYEAALALSTGCCCTMKTLAALLIVAGGAESDGKPPETSARVKAMALQALERCTYELANRPAGPSPKAEADGTGATGVQLAAFFTPQVPCQQIDQLLDLACRFIAQTVSTSAATATVVNGQPNLAGNAVNNSSPNRAQDDAIFDEAVQSLRQVRRPPAPVVPPFERAQPPRPLMLTSPPALLNPGQ